MIKTDKTSDDKKWSSDGRYISRHYVVDPIKLRQQCNYYYVKAAGKSAIATVRRCTNTATPGSSHCKAHMAG